MDELEGRTVSVIGAGASGEAAARLVLHLGGKVYVSDEDTGPAASARGAELRAVGADVELGRHDVERIAASDLVVTSPGIPPTAPVLRALRARAVDWISEPELAVRFLRAPLIAVTGTNGKTTTAALIAHLLVTADLRVGLGGNIGAGLGPAASDLARADASFDWVVLEMSSFQLADVDRFRPDIGVVTNLAPDHLDRYPTLDRYFADKSRLFANADEDSVWVLLDDPEVEALAGDAPGRRIRFGADPAEGRDGWVEDGTLLLRGPAGHLLRVPTSELPLLGAHNRLNALAAGLAALAAGATPGVVRAGLRTATPLPHRLEPVAEIDGVLWVNDSKATNVAAAVSGIASMERPVVALLGGKDKGESFAPLRPVLQERARAAIAYGAVRGRLAAELGGSVPVHTVAGNLAEVLARARELARDGDAVLLSPACSSYDMFTNYEERGREFVTLVRGGG